MADPGFPVGGVDPLKGRGPPTQALFGENVVYAKMKELGPVGGVCRARPLDLPMQNIYSCVRPYILQNNDHTLDHDFTTELS